MQRGQYKPDSLSKLTGELFGQNGYVPKPTIVRWANGFSKKPRDWSALIKVARALRLTESETDRLLKSAHQPQLVELAVINKDQDLKAMLGDWDNQVFGSNLPHQVDDSLPPAPPPTLIPKPSLFIGRSVEIRQVTQALQEKHLALISGMPGMGKSALAAVLARQWLHQSGARVYWYQCNPGDSVENFIWDFAGFMSQNGKPGLWEHLQHTLLVGVEFPTDEAIFGYLVKLAEGEDLLLCLDDVHYITKDSRLSKLFKRLEVAIKSGSLTLLLTADRFLPFLTDGYQLALRGLHLDDFRQVFAEKGIALSEQTLAALHIHTSGNPWLLLLAREAIQQVTNPEALVDELSETEDIERFLIDKIDQKLSAPEREVMTALAILAGFPGQRDAIEAILDRSDFHTDLRRLADRYLVIVHAGQGRRAYSLFGLLLSFYYRQLRPSMRSEMHQRAGAYYENVARDPGRAAFHYQRSGDLRRSTSLVAIDTRRLLYQGNGYLLEEILAGFHKDELSRDQWALVNIARGQVATFLRDSRRARQSFKTALEALENLPESPTVHAYQIRASRGMGELLELETPADALGWFRRALKHAQEVAADSVGVLHIKTGTALIAQGDLDAGLQEVQEGLALIPNPESQERVSGLINLGACLSMQGKFEAARAAYQEGLAISQEIRDDFHRLQILGNLAIDQEIQGDWVSATQGHQKALELAEQLGAAAEQAKLNNNLGVLYTNLGNFQAAGEYLARALELVSTHQISGYEAYVLTSLVELNIRRQDWALAAGYLAQAQRLIAAKQILYLSPYECYYRALICLGLGNALEALETARLAVDRARQLELPFEEGIALRGLALALDAGGEPDQALDAFSQSYQLLKDDPYESARTCFYWGKALLFSDPGSGRDLLETARTTFQRLGAREDIDLIYQVLTANDAVN